MLSSGLRQSVRASWRRAPRGLQGCRSFCTADEDKYLELKQLKDIKSEDFYDLQGQKRRYFYYVDLQGRLFLEDTRPKNIATSLKSAKFLRFFFSQVRSNSVAQCKSKEEEEDLEYPFCSPCGKEMNFINHVHKLLVHGGAWANLHLDICGQAHRDEGGIRVAALRRLIGI